MNIKILGCSGGLTGAATAGASSGSTCIQVSESIIIDAGSGLNRLSLEQMRNIEHVVLTHAHMDHICALPMFLGNLFDHIDHPVTIHALPETIEVLKDCIFNSQIWPDLTQLPSAEKPLMQFHTVQPWRAFTLDDIEFTPFFVEHSVPTVGYSLRHQQEHFVFAADTTASEVLNDELNRLGNIDTLMIECSFPNSKAEIALMSRHMTPRMVELTLESLAAQPHKIWITHLKPSYEQQIRHDIRANPDYHHWQVLR
ncbi:3',5'-cyclic-nucleotide phosphodiesterase [Aliidiomarina minuta]|uniref:3',5'-cyclic-nucleotide phosphodiesterase n=1 Tax=Aliidiomarina minuta TaxID=880057 RepID=A0A432W833_9GAMM|nr:3',5'-cyclic-nucleotide phosphodiesterase [Aliidiomarina minuta]RUO26244.1 3',5'-cyclic-nucleotide phosphodiesterase [Aliidiomarina minuta]